MRIYKRNREKRELQEQVFLGIVNYNPSTSFKNIADLCRYCNYLEGCLGHKYIDTSTLYKLIDYRYLYVEDRTGIGHYVYGIAREAAARELRKFRMDRFGDTDFLHSLDHYIHNPSVTGFFIEQDVLSTIAHSSLDIGIDIYKIIKTIIFKGNFPLSKGQTSLIFYCLL